MTPEDKAYYSDGNYPLFELMSQEHGLTLTEGQLFDVINCVRLMDEAVKPILRICDYCRDEVMSSNEYCSICNNLLRQEGGE